MEELFDIVKTYRDRFKEECAKVSAETFEELFQKSGVDAEANAITVQEEAQQQQQLAKFKSRAKWCLFGIFFLVAAIIGAVVALPPWLDQLQRRNPDAACSEQMAAAIAVGGIVLLLAATVCLLIARRRLKKSIDGISTVVEKLHREGWEQLKPLNDLFTWQTVTDIIQKVLPQAKFDSFFSSGRLQQLRQEFGWDDSFNNDRSILGCQSGSLNGNPFVLARSVYTSMGTKSYTGSMTIHWTEREAYVDAKGNSRTRLVTRSQVLTATVEKPCPCYYDKSMLIFGNEAAPELSFTRAPTRLADCGDGFLDRRKLNSAIDDLRKQSSKSTTFTIMANEEFDAIFHAVDRDNETQFRLLFTALAQQQMLELLRDKEDGYGDDFHFIKSHKINVIMPEHLNDLQIDANPAVLTSWNLEQMREHFSQFVNDYFRSFYFAFAPILSIPLYQQYQSDAEVYKNVYGCRQASFWEFEAVANSYGEEQFKHPDCVTRNILKITGEHRDSEDTATINVTAYGYTGIERTDYVSTLGGDGHYHDVPVQWIQYVPVERTTPVSIHEDCGNDQPGEQRSGAAAEAWNNFVSNWNNSGKSDRQLRRFIYSFRNQQ